MLAAAGLALWLAVDVIRQRQLGTADTGLWFTVGATCVGLVAVIGVGWGPERRRLSFLLLGWLATAVLVDAGVEWPASRLAATVWALMLALQAPAYVHAALAYPTGRVADRVERAFVLLAYPVGLLWMAFPALFFDPRGCAACSPRAPTLVFTGATFRYYAATGRVFGWLFIALGIAFAGLVARRLWRAPPGARLTLWPIVVAAVFATAAFVVKWAASLAGWRSAVGPLAWADSANLLVVPAAIFFGAAAVARRRGPVGDLVVELGSAAPGEVRDALARAIGDPSLELALWLPDRRCFVDETGAAMTLGNGTASGRAVMLIGPPERPLAAIVHDDRLLGQGPLLEAAGSAAHLALENTRLQAELRAQLLELQASRMRIVAAGDEERRRLERDLHDGAQQRLLAVGLALQLLQGDRGDPQLLTGAQRELQAALQELRELARGIHPAILTERGLHAAIGSLVDRAPLPVSTEVAAERHPATVESAAYFVVTEALANIAKHANAGSASVRVRRVDHRLVIEIADDGCGGAVPAVGSGLQGLADRVGALEGSLVIVSPPGGGTTIRAEIPCASS